MTPERRLSSLFMRSMWLDVRKNRLILLVAAVQSSHLQTHLPDISSLSLQRHHKIQEYRLASERPPALFLLGKVHSGQLEAQPGIF